MFKKFKLQTRLMIIFAPVILLGVIIASWTLLAVNRMDYFITQLRLYDREGAVAFDAGNLLARMELASTSYAYTEQEEHIAVHDLDRDAVREYISEAIVTDEQVFDDYYEPSYGAELIAAQSLLDDYDNQWEDVKSISDGLDKLDAVIALAETNDEIESNIDTVFDNFANYFNDTYDMTVQQWTVLEIGSYVSIALFLVLTVITIVLISRQIASPMVRFINAANGLAKDEYDPSAMHGLVERTDEIGFLARSFEKMADGIIADEQELRDEAEDLRAKLRNLTGE